MSSITRVFNISHFTGADPTGNSLSDAAFMAATDAAARVLQGSPGAAGAMLTINPGKYMLTPGAFVVPDMRIAVNFPGSGSTCLLPEPGASNGDLFFAKASGNEPNGTVASPIRGFTAAQGAGGAGLNGIRFADWGFSEISDLYAHSMSGAGFLCTSTNETGMEGTFAHGLKAESCAIGFCADGVNGGTSLDSSHWWIHTESNGINALFKNGAHINDGGSFRIDGTLGGGGGAGTTATLLQVGTGPNDGAVLTCMLGLGFEADAGSTECLDIVVNTSPGRGILSRNADINLISASADFTAGSVTGGRLALYGSAYGAPLLDALAAEAGVTSHMHGPSWYGLIDTAGVWEW